MTNFFRASLAIVLFLPFTANAACNGTEAFGTYCRMFAPHSPWNIVPVNPVLGTAEVVPLPPAGAHSHWQPQISAGAYSVGAYLANASNSAMTVYGVKTEGIWLPDRQAYGASVTIPHWPAGTTAATGTDGHADIIDPTTGIVHSFWQLKKDTATGKWRAQQYAWTKLGGRGFPDPAHYFQGARAAAVPTSGGIIRKDEANDSNEMYYHALAMSMAANGLSKNPTYVYPATSADSDAATVNSGVVPEGARLMIPATFDVSTIKTPLLRKVIRTLRAYGAIVVDRNTDTPFVIYVELGTAFNMVTASSPSNVVAAELQIIRKSLRMVSSVPSYRAGALKAATTERYRGAPVGYWLNDGPDKTPLNMFSMRYIGAAWATLEAGSSTYKATFNSWLQGADFPATIQHVQQSLKFAKMNSVSWGGMVAGAKYTFAVSATGGGQAQFQVLDRTCSAASAGSVTTAMLGNGASTVITWPATTCASNPFKITVMKPATSSALPASVSPTLMRKF